MTRPRVVPPGDGVKVGRVLAWSPQGVGDFADVAWALTGLLGNGPGVSSVEVRRSVTGAVHAVVMCDTAGYVYAVASRLGWRVSSACDEGYANAHGPLGEVIVDLTWLAPSTEGPRFARLSGPAVPGVLS